ncbi:MAG TPA: HWE histidine kinase domain-containing protein [Tabrizicola sp.]
MLDLSVIRDMPASVMVLDRDLRFVTASNLYLETVGQTMAGLLGRHLFEAFPEVEARRRPLEQSIRLALQGESNAIERLPYSIPDPKDLTRTVEAWWRCRHNPLVNSDGSIGHVVQITENITDLVRAEALNEAIARELQHRVGNLLSLVDIVARRTATHALSLPDFMDRFGARVQSMARTHSYLVGVNWDRMSIRELISRQLLHGHEELTGQVSIAGPEIMLGASEAQTLSMVVHELSTNSVKYGALKERRGRLDVAWSIFPDDGYRLDWIERGLGAVTPPVRSGFGSMILDRIGPAQLGGSSERAFGVDGLHYSLTVARRTPPASEPLVDRGISL